MTIDNQNQVRPGTAQLIFGDGTPKKALLTALVVGSVLAAINHGDVLLSGQMPPIWKLLLTYCVPYCVTTWGAVTGKRGQWDKDTENIADLSFFNFRNAITATYFADEDLKVLKANKNFPKFFPALGNITDFYFPDVLRKLGVSEAQIAEFTTGITDNGFILIPDIHIRVENEERVFYLLSTRTRDNEFSYLNGVQGQFIDRTEEWRLNEKRANDPSSIARATV